MFPGLSHQILGNPLRFSRGEQGAIAQSGFSTPEFKPHTLSEGVRPYVFLDRHQCMLSARWAGSLRKWLLDMNDLARVFLGCSCELHARRLTGSCRGIEGHAYRPRKALHDSMSSRRRSNRSERR